MMSHPVLLKTSWFLLSVKNLPNHVLQTAIHFFFLNNLYNFTSFNSGLVCILNVTQRKRLHRAFKKA